MNSHAVASIFTFNGKKTGEWLIYINGEVVGRRSNGWQPTEIAPKTLKDVPKPKTTYQKFVDTLYDFFKD